MFEFNPKKLTVNATKYGDNYIINSTKEFCRLGELDFKDKKASYAFAYEEKDKQRAKRSGGSYKRKEENIFLNTMYGKFAEFAVTHTLQMKYNVSQPDLTVLEKGEWDSFDLEINGKKVSVKSSRHYANLLFLETADYDKDGFYIHNKNTEKEVKYDYFIFVRIKLLYAGKPLEDYQLKDFMKKYGLQNDRLSSFLEKMVVEYDIPGYVTQEEFKYLIKEKFVIPKGARFNLKIDPDIKELDEKYIQKHTMDAENYYIQARDMHPIEDL